MSEKKTIRVIKKGEELRKTTKPEVDSARDVARQIVGTVSNWVTEFQQKRHNETHNALRFLSKRTISEPMTLTERERSDRINFA